MAGDLRDDTVLFFAKFAVMIANGVPITKALTNLEKESTSEALSQAAKKILESVTAGRRSLAEAMEDFPDLFDKRTVQLIRAGEETGCLDLTLRIIPEYLLFGQLEEWKK